MKAVVSHHTKPIDTTSTTGNAWRKEVAKPTEGADGPQRTSNLRKHGEV